MPTESTYTVVPAARYRALQTAQVDWDCDPWQRRGLAGVLHPDGDGGTRTLVAEGIFAVAMNLVLSLYRCAPISEVFSMMY